MTPSDVRHASVLLVSPSDLILLRLLAALRWPGSFTCDADGNVWLAGRRSVVISTDDRPVPLLAEIAEEVLGVRPRGGRFFVDDLGVRLASNGVEVASFLVEEFAYGGDHWCPDHGDGGGVPGIED